MNFNLTNTHDYDLQGSMTDELINLYGLNCKFLVVEKINRDTTVFGDFSHIKTDNKKIFSIYAYPENTESTDNTSYAFSQFGYYSNDSIGLFVSKKTIEDIFPNVYSSKGLNDILGNLIVLPSGGIVEIVDAQVSVPGVSNLFTNIDNKNVYKLTCTQYMAKSQNEIAPITAVTDEFVTLENYFDELLTGNTAQDTEAAEVDQVSGNAIVPDIDSVFGRF